MSVLTSLSLLSSPLAFTSTIGGVQESDVMGAPATSAGGPVVHITLKKPDPNRGVIKLVKHRNTTTTAVSTDTTLVTNTYEEICTEPCGVAIDTAERPAFYFVRDGQPISYAFRLHQLDGEVTLRVKPVNRGLLLIGVTLAVLIIGIPMWVAAVSRVWVAQGAPGTGSDFQKVKKAKL